MDAKYFSVPGVGLTGSKLLWSLSGCLSLSALLLDFIAGRSPASLTSLFLPLVSCTILSGVAGYWVVPLLRNLKAGQFIREDGPQAHLKKAGTPTMGGIFVVPVAVIFSLLATGFAPVALAASGLTLAFGFIGWVDDWQILRYRSNKGISPRMKLLLQLVFGGLFCFWLATQSGIENVTRVSLPLGIIIPFGLLFWPLAIFVMMAESNATNLTDGVDGLAAGTGAIALLGLGAFVGSPTADGIVHFPELMTFAAATSGSYLGFLIHNRNPARVFMGDTGSLALGGALAAIALIGNLLWVLFVIGGLFLAESLSVIAQVGYYKATKGPDGIGKRLFKMAPLHHHLELVGWPETRVVGTFYAIAAGLAALCYFVH